MNVERKKKKKKEEVFNLKIQLFDNYYYRAIMLLIIRYIAKW